MKKPTILVFTTSYYPFVGGVEIAIQETARRLSGEFDFLIMTARRKRDLPKHEIRPEGKIIRIGFGNRMDKWLLPLAAPFYYRGFASIVWGIDISQGALAAAILKFFMPQIPFVFTIQYGEGGARLKRGRLGIINLAFRFMLARADFVIAISRSLLEYAREYGYECPAEVVHNGADLENFKNPAPEERGSPTESGRQNSNFKSNSKFKENGKIIVTTSRLVKKNGIDILIRAIAEVIKTMPHIRCHIIGDGPERKNLEMLAAQCGVKDLIYFFGAVPYEKLPRYLHEADLFVRPSRSEGMGNSFVEALAAGIPIIGTPVGGIRDIIEDEKTGFFCGIEDIAGLAEKIIYVLGNKAHAGETVEQGMAMVKERFSWEGIARSYKKIFLATATQRKKVLVATPLFPPDIGGPATYSALLLKELPRYGIQTRIVNFGEVRHLPKGIRHVRYFLKMLMQARDADIIYTLDPVSVGLPSFLAAFFLHKTFMLKIVGDYAWEQYQQKIQNDNVKFKNINDFQNEKFDFFTETRRYIQKFVARRAENIIVPSGYLKTIVSRWGVDEERVKIIYNSFEMPSFPISKEESRKKLGLSGTVFISAGRLVPWKGFPELIDCMPEIIKEIPDAKLVIVGNGPDMSRLVSLASRNELQEKIIFTGKLSRQNLLTHIVAGDVFLLNTGYEGFSHTLLEAMALGIPVITTRVCGNPEIIDHMKDGLLVEYNNKEEIKKSLLLLSRDAKLRQMFIAGGQEKAEKFNKERMIKETASLFHTIEAKPL